MGATFCAHLLLYVGLQDKEVVVFCFTTEKTSIFTVDTNS